jgi:aryl-alcohol dehydrogenase-like predicted oxidoreductase
LSVGETTSLVHEAVSLGIRFFDTAPAYGASEEKLGRALKPLQAEVVVATKFGEHWKGDGSTFVDHSANAILASLARSLELLGKVHLVQVHKCSREVLQNESVMHAVAVLKKLGVAVGASVGDPETLEAALEAGVFDSLQFSLSTKDRRFVPMVSDVVGEGLLPIINRPYAMGDLEIASHQERCRAFEFIGKNVPRAVILTGTASPNHLRENAAAFTEVFGSTS